MSKLAKEAGLVFCGTLGAMTAVLFAGQLLVPFYQSEPQARSDPDWNPLGVMANADSVAPVAAAPAMALASVNSLGRTALPEEVAAWDIDVRPDGAGLPEGRGDALTGEEVFAENCAVCHGDFGEAVGRWPVLAGGHDTLDSEDPVKTIGSYWPYLSTVYDYVYRAMPFGNAQSLSHDEVYAITAYLLYVNDLVEEDFELSHENFAEVRLPNEANFYPDDRAELEYSVFTGEPCMENCKESVEITGRARIIDVTPEETAAAAAAGAQAASGDAGTPTEEAPLVVAAAPATAEPTPAPSEDSELIASGEKLFKKCKACHAIGAGAKNKSGPLLTEVIGRTMGSVDGFKYSAAFKKAAEEGRVWDRASMDAFLLKPKGFMKGTKMAFSGLRKEADRVALIAYLASVTE